MDFKKLERLAKLCHKYSIKSLTVDGVFLELAEIRNTKDALAPKETANELSTAPVEVDDTYTEEDALFWSSNQA